MSRQSYLQRIAEPLRAGDPVLFAVPRPLPTDARAPIEAPATRLDAAEPGRATTLRRRAASNAATRAAPDTSAVGIGAQTTAPAIADTTASTPAPTVIAPPPSHGIAATDDDAARRAPALRPALTETQLRPATPAPNEPAIARTLTSTAGAPPDRASTPRHSASTWTAAPSASDSAAPDLAPPDMTVADIVAPAARPEAAAIAAQPPPAAISPPTPMATPATGATLAPRIHIGTVEVRAAPPPAAASSPRAAPAAPRGAAAPIARGYAWRFGLPQG